MCSCIKNEPILTAATFRISYKTTRTLVNYKGENQFSSSVVFQLLAPAVDWLDYLSSSLSPLDLNDTEPVVLYAREYLQQVSDLINKTDRRSETPTHPLHGPPVSLRNEPPTPAHLSVLLSVSPVL